MHPLLLSCASIFQIILINIVLSGDNALVIALAARRLPIDLRRKALIWGVGLAVAMQLLLTVIVSYLLLIPGLQLVGAIMLGMIACRLLQEEAASEGDVESTPASLRTAITRIAIADLIMSLDNVLAIAGVSQSNTVQLIFGLTLSIGITLVSSTAIIALMDRFRWIAFAGTSILALTAASMMSHDFAALGIPGFSPTNSPGMSGLMDWPFRLAFLIVCLTSVRWWPALQAIRWTGFKSGEPAMDRPDKLLEV